jgi:predicted MFS family arabinose efflux permease
MLVLGTGLPQLVRGLGITPDWRTVFYTASSLAVIAGIAVYWLGDGPHHSQRRRMHWGGVLSAFRAPGFRSAAFGYFGHMWELYAFWAIAPFFIADIGRGISANSTYLAAATVFVAGGIGCVLGGAVSHRWGSARVAIIALAGSAFMCLVYPFMHGLSYSIAIAGLVVWGFFVVADSPQFSALAARACAREEVGGALAFMNSIGFAISIVSIELVTRYWSPHNEYVAWLLLPGPLFGLWAMRACLSSATRA